MEGGCLLWALLVCRRVLMMGLKTVLNTGCYCNCYLCGWLVVCEEWETACCVYQCAYLCTYIHTYLLTLVCRYEHAVVIVVVHLLASHLRNKSDAAAVADMLLLRFGVDVGVAVVVLMCVEMSLNELQRGRNSRGRCVQCMLYVHTNVLRTYKCM